MVVVVTLCYKFIDLLLHLEIMTVAKARNKIIYLMKQQNKQDNIKCMEKMTHYTAIFNAKEGQDFGRCLDRNT